MSHKRRLPLVPRSLSFGSRTHVSLARPVESDMVETPKSSYKQNWKLRENCLLARENSRLKQDLRKTFNEIIEVKGRMVNSSKISKERENEVMRQVSIVQSEIDSIKDHLKQLSIDIPEVAFLGSESSENPENWWEFKQQNELMDTAFLGEEHLDMITITPFEDKENIQIEFRMNIVSNERKPSPHPCPVLQPTPSPEAHRLFNKMSRKVKVERSTVHPWNVKFRRVASRQTVTEKDKNWTPTIVQRMAVFDFDEDCYQLRE